MLVKLMNWFRGYLYVKIHGVSPERFINLCCNKKIFIWDLKQVDEEYRFHITIKNYKKLKPIARKTGLVPKIIKKIGFPFFVYRHKKRKIFFAGALLCILLIYIMSLYIWDITIVGGSKYTTDAMVKFLNKNTVHTGMMIKKVDCQKIEETIRLTYNDIGWVSAEVRGTRLIIKITETNMPTPAKVAVDPSHMVATKDAIVEKIITRSGTPLVRPGDVVKKGDILVSGILAVKGDFDEILRYQPVVADADIVCKSFYNYQSTFNMTYYDKVFTGKVKKGYYFGFFGKKLILYNPRNSYHKYDIIVNENSLHLTNSFYLPFLYGTIATREYEEEKKNYSKEEAISIANERLNRYLDTLNKNKVDVKDNNIKTTIKNNQCITRGRIFVEEPAWEYKAIQEDEWRIEQKDEHNGDNN